MTGCVLCCLAAWAAGAAEMPLVEVTADDTTVSKSCRLAIPAGRVIADADGDGVIHVAAPGIVIEFAPGAVLRGSKLGVRPDEYRGVGIRLNGHRNVTIRNARLHGYWCGLWASKANGLVLDGVDASDNRRAHLRSTPAAEDGADWLRPHRNDGNEWLRQYAAAIYVEDSNGIVVRNSRVRHGQNALCLDRVGRAKVYDNDLSFNSGWGIAMWRSSNNVISRNAVDFCIRGYSHGVYNRGQDSAGLLMFEQCCRNVIAENSLTHGGDGIFGFAGVEALGDVGKHPTAWYKRRGNNDNLIVANDCSYAAAHGLEMTFSFGNRVLGNTFRNNAICGIWGGYSQETLVAGNTFTANGAMGYGLERGGVNIEHGRANRIVHNRFQGNTCGVHLWWDDDAGLLAKPWARANVPDSVGNVVAGNDFRGDGVAIHLRGRSETAVGPNAMHGVRQEIVREKDSRVTKRPKAPASGWKRPDYPVHGRTRPVGARRELRGRQNIIMTEWGPWDHASPLVRKRRADAESIVFELHRMPGKVRAELTGDGVTGRLTTPEGETPTYTVRAREPGVWPYVLEIASGDFRETLRGTFVSVTWDATFFRWTKGVDPRKDVAAWRKLAGGPTAVSCRLGELKLPYGFGGPSDVKAAANVTAAKLGGNHFGMIARAKLPLPKGRWRFETLSDDGVRVTVGGRAVIENWAWHGPTKDTGTLELARAATVEVIVEHFEIDGYAVLELRLSPAD